MSDAVKHLEKQCSDTTLPNNAVSVEPNSYNAPANRCAQEDVITQQCTGAELCSGPPVIGQQTSDSPQGGNMAMVPGVKFATEGTAEQVTPNYPLEGLMVTGRSTREVCYIPLISQFCTLEFLFLQGFGRCPFLDGRPEELTCYVHALDLACKVPMNVCSLVGLHVKIIIKLLMYWCAFLGMQGPIGALHGHHSERAAGLGCIGHCQRHVEVLHTVTLSEL